MVLSPFSVNGLKMRELRPLVRYGGVDYRFQARPSV
jgi:hypothetical protein